jgi:phospholipase/carboxylesterase
MRPEDLEPFARSLNCPALFFFPRRPHAVGSHNRAWWQPDLERRAQQLAAGPRDLFQEFAPGRPAARETLCTFLDELRDTYPDLPIVLGGFSQGAMLACDTVLCAEQRVAGLVLFSSTRIAFSDWLANREALSQLPVLISHGRHDTDLSYAAGEAMRDFHAGSGARITWQPFEGGHEIPLVVWRALRRFLGELYKPST